MDAVRAVPDDEELPAEELTTIVAGPAPTDRSLLRATIVILLVLLVPLAATRLVGTAADVGELGSPAEDSPAPTWPERDWPAALERLRDTLPAETPVWRPDPDATLRALTTAAPDAMRDARAAHRPLDAKVSRAHDLFEEALDRISVHDAGWSIWRGIHPHPDRLTAVSARDIAAMALVLHDVQNWCDAHPAAAAADLHERHDRGLLQARSAAWLVELNSDDSALTELSNVVSNLWQLVVIKCCPTKERRAALTGCLLDLPAFLDETLDRLERPSHDACRATATTLHFEAKRVIGAAKAIGSGNEALRHAASQAAIALRDAATRLNDWPTQTTHRDEAERARFQGAYFSGLATETAGRSPRELFDVAIAELRAASEAKITAWEEGYDPPARARPIRTPTKRIRRLRDAVPRWVGPISDDPGVVFHSMTSGSAEWQGLLYAPGPDSPPAASAFVGTWPDPGLDASDAEHEKRVRQHLAAHETYPGHHLQAHLARDVCILRRTLSSTVIMEGWATYAEDLIHETGQCRDDVMDRYVRASDRVHEALAAALEMLHACGRHSATELVKELTLSDEPETLVGLQFAVRPGASTPYLFGRHEIMGLRREAEARDGARFDLPRFHRRLLELGSVPSSMLAAELEAE